MILADTGFFVAFGNRNDIFHSKAQQQLNILKEPLITVTTQKVLVVPGSIG